MPKVLTCRHLECKVTFADWSNRRRHEMNVQHGCSSKGDCPECTKAQADVAKPLKPSCSFCQKTFANISNLKRHQEKHSCSPKKDLEQTNGALSSLVELATSIKTINASPTTLPPVMEGSSPVRQNMQHLPMATTPYSPMMTMSSPAPTPSLLNSTPNLSPSNYPLTSLSSPYSPNFYSPMVANPSARFFFPSPPSPSRFALASPSPVAPPAQSYHIENHNNPAMMHERGIPYFVQSPQTFQPNMSPRQSTISDSRMPPQTRSPLTTKAITLKRVAKQCIKMNVDQKSWPTVQRFYGWNFSWPSVEKEMILQRSKVKIGQMLPQTEEVNLSPVKTLLSMASSAPYANLQRTMPGPFPPTMQPPSSIPQSPNKPSTTMAPTPTPPQAWRDLKQPVH